MATGKVQAADAIADFYKGKQITVICSTAGGGAYDTYARMVAKHMGKHIPGTPGMVVQNMPGASGLKAINYIATVAPKDGTVFAAVHAGIPSAPLTQRQEAEFSPNAMSWLSSATKELYVGYVFQNAPIRSMEEALTIETLMGGTAVGSFGPDMTILSNAFFGTKFKLVLGYKDAIEGRLAMQRGETHGTFGTNFADVFKLSEPTWLTEKKAFIIVQYGVKRHPTLPDTPTFLELAKSEAQRQAITFMVARLDHGKPYVAPPAMPQDRLAALRRAFDQTMKDPAFLSDLAQLQLEVDGPMTGEEMAALIAQEAATPPDVLKLIEETIAKYRGTK